MHSHSCKGWTETFEKRTGPASCWKQGQLQRWIHLQSYVRRLRACPAKFWKSPRMEISISPGNLIQHLITLTAEKFSLRSHRISLAAAWSHAQVLLHLLYNQPLGSASSPWAFSCSGWKRPALPAASQYHIIQPLKHLVGLSWTCSSLPTSLWYCKTQSWAQSSAALALCSHRAEWKKLCYRTKYLKHRKSQVLLLLDLTASLV